MAAERMGEEWRGKVGRMSQAEIDEFLAGGVICRLSCLDEDGWPYTVPVWFEHSDGGFYIIPRERSDWARYIQRDPRVFLCIDEPGTQRKVLVKGEAQVREEPNVGGRWVEIANRMSHRYLGEHGPDYLVPTLNEPRWLIWVKPLQVTTWQGVDWAQRYKHYQWPTGPAATTAPR
jgi:general stress protein 26